MESAKKLEHKNEKKSSRCCSNTLDYDSPKTGEEKCRRLIKMCIPCMTALTFIVVGSLCLFFILPHSEEPRLLRRISISYPKSELLLPEERDVLSVIRTSFVPSKTILIPIEEYDTENDLRQREDIKDSFLSDDNPFLTSSEDWYMDDEDDVARGEYYAELETFDWKREARRVRRNAKEKTSDNALQSFWKYTGDPEKVREHQSRVMKQNMDTTADPCEDFYQYSCGNWEILNPIPSDKAGFDTFEMLRENLDQVLKQLLTSEKVKQWENLLFLADNTVVPKYLQMEPLKIISKLDYTDDEDVHYSSMEDKESFQTDRKKRNSKNGTQQIKYVDVFRKRRDIVLERVDETVQNSRIYFINKLRKHKRSLENTDPNENKDEDIVDAKSVSLDENSDEKVDDKNNEEKSVDAITKAKYLYESCMNYDILKKREHQPLIDLLNKLGGWPMLDPNWNETSFDWVELIGILRLFNNDILISEWVGPDIRKSDEFVVQFDQSNLGLPAPEYYLHDNNKDFLDAYKQYITSVTILLGVESTVAHKGAEDLIAFEKQLANIIIPSESRRNISELYQRLSLKELTQLVPKIKWKRYLSIVLNRTVSWNESVVMYASKYAKDLAELIEVTPPRTVANYILWRFIRHRVNSLDDKFQDAKQKFLNKLFGRESSPPRWKNCVSQVNANMGMALGSMFVSKYFDENSKNDTLVMTREIQHAFKELLNMTSWIDDETKRLATDKVDAMMLRIGYPDCVLDHNLLNEKFKDLTVNPETYFENTLNILRHLTKTEHAKLGETVNKTQWNTAPAIVNAYYSRNKNQILFPAGLLQPPFYHKHFPKCLNFGGIGVVIGHEITHGFDDKGRLFDKHGNLQRWWPETAIHLFHKKAQCLIDQYSEYRVSEVSMSLDGLSTQGENIADNGGVKQAFRAYKHWLTQNDNIEETLPGINATSSQLFFINFAQIWCGVMRPEAMKNKLKVAVHSPGRFRVIGTVSNSEDFAKAFNCPIGSPMNPAKKCDVW